MESIGGAEQDLLVSLRHLDRAQWLPAVACPLQGDFRRRVAELDIPVFPVTFPAWRKVSSCLSRYRAVWGLSAVLKRFRPELIHVNDLWWAPHTWRAVRWLRGRPIPMIVHVRQNIKPKKVRAYDLDRVDHVLAVSRQIHEALERGGVATQRVSTLYSGVDVAAISRHVDGATIRMRHGIPSDAFVVGTVANLLPIKGLDTMIEALPSVRIKVPTAHYVVVGGGSDAYLRDLLNLCKDRAVSDVVHFVGFQHPPWAYLAAMDLYVQPSRNEALGIAAVEASAMGKPIVAAHVGGLPEVVIDGLNGILFRPGDVSALSKAVVSLFQEPTVRLAMGSAGRERVRQVFDLEKTMSQLEQIYQHTLAGLPCG
ncbi:MAG TPA: glycosyltransferase family 4 protein [Nitrospira sp.]|nr:glycosyltransferase family 4 protein [Nitrospira sp.]